jgi:general secretion pathway protein D
MKHKLSTLALAALVAVTLQVPALAQDPVTRSNGKITLNFANAEIEAVARTMSSITGKNVVVDPRVKGQISLFTEKPVSASAAYSQFLAALRLVGASAIEADGLVKIVPEAEAKVQSPSVVVDAAKVPGNRVVTQIFNLQHVSANALLPVLRPLISANNAITPNTASNALVITDYADNLQRIALIIAASDLPSATDIEVIPVKHGIAADIALLAQRLTEGGNTPAATESGFRTTIIAEPRSNAIIVRSANQARTALVKSLIARLDQPSSASAAGNIHVVYLKNADAVKLATTLRAAMSATGGAAATSAATATPSPTAGNPASASVSPSAQPSTGGQVQADPATNSLIITASEPQYRQLRAVIDQLDARRAQVFVEALIAEVNSDRSAELSIQLQDTLKQLAVWGTNFGAAGNNILALSGQGVPTAGTAPTLVPGTGANIGAMRTIQGFDVLGFLARALETTGEGNVRSTPNLLTLDNEEAKIVIGQNVPFVTGQYTNSSSGATNPFQTVERKDVGLTLRVKPQISENGTIKMQIFHEISSIQAASVNSATGIITNKRSIESNVLVEDGSIVILGGLFQEEYAGNADKVPLLGDIPLVGNLFKSESRSRKRTNLMVFLRPVVVRDADSTQRLSQDRYDLMRRAQQAVKPSFNLLLDVGPSPLLPAKPGSVDELQTPAEGFKSGTSNLPDDSDRIGAGR